MINTAVTINGEEAAQVWVQQLKQDENGTLYRFGYRQIKNTPGLNAFAVEDSILIHKKNPSIHLILGRVLCKVHTHHMD